MTAAATSDAWTSRPAVEARTADTVQDLVGTESVRLQAMMFTATPKDELDSISRFQQLKDQAWAGQLRAIVRLHGRATVAHREFAADEVALAIGAAPTTGGNLLTEALAICELPGLLEALEAGILTERHIKAVMRAHPPDRLPGRRPVRCRHDAARPAHHPDPT